MPFDHKIYFDNVRDSLFHGNLAQNQVDGQDAILNGWEKYLDNEDVRFLAYMLATTYHETAQEMMPVEEYGKGDGMAYGVPDPETLQTYYGRGFVQLTWRDNYARADREAGWENADSCEWHADNALNPYKAGRIMWFGMSEGWFRASKDGQRQTLSRWFNDLTDDAFEAREIINGDKNVVPDWGHGLSIGDLIEGYYELFLQALQNARAKPPVPQPEPVPTAKLVEIEITAPEGVLVNVYINGKKSDAA